ncbi:hypothetical protein LJK88_25755 [Paenibacillus sp. P26]|nr:hypothetical protein LJK88_25755 [Paenibacillus sp. P26]
MNSSIVIDIHTHPAFFEPICKDEARVAFRKKLLGYPKSGNAPLGHIFNQMKADRHRQAGAVALGSDSRLRRYGRIQ